jgi:hypothetical protein
MLAIPPAGKIFPAGFMCGRHQNLSNPTMAVLDLKLPLALNPTKKAVNI